jgi:hypothetical protein
VEHCGTTLSKTLTTEVTNVKTQPGYFSDLNEEIEINVQHMAPVTLTLGQILEQQAMLTAFRHASNSIGIATGTIISHVAHDEAAKSVTGDHYFLELIAESELRYKRLKAAAEDVVESRNSVIRSVESIAKLWELLK